MRTILLILAGLFLFAATDAVAEQPYAGKKILYINSYHLGYGGSDPITQGVEKVLGETGVELKIIYMDTKRNSGEEFSQQAALQAKAVIEEFQPDVVIASDDNASKYLIMPYYKDAELPFVFCGVNWDASVYGFPYKNVTGMIEVALVSEIRRHLDNYAKGKRIGFIAADTLSERKNLNYYVERFNIDFEKIYLTKTFAEWKEKFLSLQDEVDMIMMTTSAGIPDWDDEAAKNFVEENIRIPVGVEHLWEMPLALIGVTKDYEEMGIWSAHAALKILDGVSPDRIPIAANKNGYLWFNKRIAAKLGIDEVPPLAQIVD
ncbi:MAG: ABC transporter substrate-binding protein [Candidatus Competibacteraceae bacterium]|nr:ABC transporter substrate-binding protein [Candidatus Competibacteraceae bacterium]